MKKLALKDGELYYETKGSGDSLLMLHAGVADSRMWGPQFGELAKYYCVTRCDMRGYGMSPLPNALFAYHEDVRSLVETRGEATWIVAASFGARVAIDFAISYPSMIRGLILISPAVAGFAPTGSVKEYNEKEDNLLEAGKIDETVELNLRMWVDGPARNPSEVDSGVRDLVRIMQLRALGRPEPPGVDLIPIDPPAIDRLEEIHKPTLIISGELDVDEFLDLARLLEQRIPDARRIVLPGCAHMASMELPDQVNREIVEFAGSTSA